MSSFVRGSARAVEESVREVAERRRLRLELEVPGEARRVGLELGPGATGLEQRAADPDVGAGRRGDLVGADGELRRLRAGELGVEVGEPDRAGARLAGPLVDGVADPDGGAAARPRRLDVEALVVSGAGSDRGKARLGSHGRDPISPRPTPAAGIYRSLRRARLRCAAGWKPDAKAGECWSAPSAAWR